VTKPLGRCGHGPLGRCGQCQWQHARCGSSTELGSKSSSHADCGCVSMFGSGLVFLLLDFASLRLGDANFLLDGTPNCFVGEAQ